MIFSRSVLIVALVLVTLNLEIPSGFRSSAFAGQDNATIAATLSWNPTRNEAPFLQLPNAAHADLDAQLVYPSEEFLFPLAQSLYYDAKCDCYALTLSTNGSKTSRIVNFWRAPRGFYRTANGPYLELEELDSLKALTDLHGRRFLFAQVGDGEWHCVSIHDSSGGDLLVDYRADGLIGQLRDSFARSAVPTYFEGRIPRWRRPGPADPGKKCETHWLRGWGVSRE